MYHIINWDTNKSMAVYDDLAIAKKECRAMGHTGGVYGKWHPPVAFVAIEIEICGKKVWGCEYNPRFKV